MELQTFVEWFVTAILGAGIVKIFDEIFHRARKRQEQKEAKELQEKKRALAKIDEIEELLKEFAKLESLYRFLARRSKSLVTSRGEIVHDSKGEPVFTEEMFEPEERFRSAFKELYGTDDIKALIAQQVVQIRLMLEEKRIIADTIDPSKGLWKELSLLLIHTDSLVAQWIEEDDFNLMVARLDEAHDKRMDIHETLQKERSRVIQ